MKGVKVDGEFLWVRKKDSKERLVARYSRELEVCPSINGDGVVLSVSVTPPEGARIAAGLILSPKQARRVIRHMQQILDALEQQ